MEPPKPYMPDRFLKQVQVVEDERTTRIRYDIADFGEFRWMEARFGGWEKSRGLRFRVKIDIFGASKGGVFLFVYLVFDNDPWTGRWAATLQCVFRILSQEGKCDLISAQKSWAINNTNYYVVAGFPVEEIRKKGSGLIASTGTVRLQIDIVWEDVQISNSYDQLLQYKQEVKAENHLAVKEREELVYLRNENRKLREQLERLSAERENHLRRVTVISEGQKAAETYMTKLVRTTEDLLKSYADHQTRAAPSDNGSSLPRRPARESISRKSNG